MPLSKTDFVRGLQCQKMLWLDAHSPQLKIIPPQVQRRLDAGNEFGDKAMAIFGNYTETTVIKEDGKLHYLAMIEKTKTLIQSGERVICEGAFSWYGNFCAVDILKKEKDGYALYEVKNAPTVRKEFIVDLAFQRLIVRKCGVPLTGCFLVLNGQQNATEIEKQWGQVCVEVIEKENILFKIFDVTKATKIQEQVAEKQIFALAKLKRKDAPLPNVLTGNQCDFPYRCWYYEHCHKNFCQNSE